MKKRDFYSCSYDEAKEIWERALDSAQDAPGEYGENEAIMQIQYAVEKIIKDRFNKIN